MVGEPIQLSSSFLIFVLFPVHKVEPKTWCVLGKTFHRVPALALVFALLFTLVCKCVYMCAAVGIKPKASYMLCKHFFYQAIASTPAILFLRQGLPCLALNS